MWELLHIGMGSRDEEYRRNLCTKLTSIPQPGLAHIVAQMARTKRTNVRQRQRKLSWKNPELSLTNREPKMHHSDIFWHVFIQQVFLFSLSLCPRTILWHIVWAFNFFSQSDAKLRNLFQCPGESRSLKHITHVIWRPTYRHTIHFS